MAFDWSIKIRGLRGGAAQFVPQGGNAGDPLNAKVNDTVSWGNETEDSHQPWPTDSHYTLQPAPPNPSLSNPIPQGQSSTPTWVVVGSSGTTVYYRCKLHPNLAELGRIAIT
jgi:hypothetical protein